MAAKIGILGESTATATGEVTVYTVPADKAARVRILFMYEGGSATPIYNVLIGTPGSEINVKTGHAAGDDLWTGILAEATPDPASSMLAKTSGMHLQNNFLDLDEPGNVVDYIVAPLPFDYFLSTGDTVRVHINENAAADHLFQVMGVEDDA